MVHDAEYKLISVDEAARKARIEAKGRSSMQPAEATSQPAGLPPFTIEKGESGGFIVWDLAAGQMEATETQADMAMKLAEGRAHMTQKVQSTIMRTTKSELNLPEDKPATQPAGT